MLFPAVLGFCHSIGIVIFKLGIVSKSKFWYCDNTKGINYILEHIQIEKSYFKL